MDMPNIPLKCVKISLGDWMDCFQCGECCQLFHKCEFEPYRLIVASFCTLLLLTQHDLFQLMASIVYNS